MTNTTAHVATARHMHHLPVLNEVGALVAIACQPARALPKGARLVPAATHGLTCLRCSGGVVRFR